LSELEEFKILQKALQNDIVLTPGGIKIKKIANLYCLDFQSSYYELEDMNSVSHFRKSDIYFCSEDISWRFEPYSDK